jgi:hypothetical protein
MCFEFSYVSKANDCSMICNHNIMKLTVSQKNIFKQANYMVQEVRSKSVWDKEEDAHADGPCGRHSIV